MLSTTKLHWPATEDLAGAYRALAALVRPGGLVLNGGRLWFRPHLPTFARLA